MAVNLESHGLPVAALYGTPVTVQDHQGEGHGQQPQAQDAGYSATSGFDRALSTGASVPQAAVEDQHAPSGGDLLSRLTGFIKAVGDVVVQLGEYIRSAGAALNGDQAAEVPAPAPQAATAPEAPALGSPAGAPVATGPGVQSPLGAPGQPITSPGMVAQARQAYPAALPDLRGGPALGSRSATPTSQREAAKLASGLGEVTASLALAAGGARGGGRALQSSGFPVLNPLPPYLGNEIAPISELGGGQPEQTDPVSVDLGGGLPEQAGPVDFGEQHPGEIHRSHSATSRPPVQPAELAMVAAAQPVESADQGFINNVIPFPGPAANDGLEGAGGGEASAQSADAADSSPRYQAIVFRPAFYGSLRC